MKTKAVLQFSKSWVRPLALSINKLINTFKMKTVEEANKSNRQDEVTISKNTKHGLCNHVYFPIFFMYCNFIR